MSSPSNGFWQSFVGSAGAWTGNTWEFDGAQQHVVYTMLTNDSLKIEWQRPLRGYWTADSSTICNRVGAE
jgi:hypothetical protein